jgi:16S rRNA G966 N2-methylase RsmD
VGIEALSRGARHAIFLEKDRVAIETIRDNLASLKVERRATVVKGAVLLTLAETPPALTVVQHSVRLALADSYGALRRTRLLRQGDNALSFFSGVQV